MFVNFLLGDVPPPGPIESIIGGNGWTLVVAGIVIAVAVVFAAKTYFRKSGND